MLALSVTSEVFLLLLAALAFAQEPCSVSDRMEDVRRVWDLVDHGPYLADGAIEIAKPPSMFVPGESDHFMVLVASGKEFVILSAWYRVAKTPGGKALDIPISVRIDRAGNVVHSTRTCVEDRSLALEFFRHLPPK